MSIRALLLCCAITALLAGCPTAPVNAPNGAAPTASSAAPPPPPDQAPPPPEAPKPPPTRLTDKELRAALQAVAILLDQGEELRAKTELSRMLESNPDSQVAQSFMRQITEDPATFFFALLKSHDSYAYTVAQGESLSTIARSKLNEPNLFYVLARYNNINPPNRLPAGQRITIPGKPFDKPVDKPIDKPIDKTVDKTADKPADKATEKPTPPGEVAMNAGLAAEKNGKYEEAYNQFLLARTYGQPVTQEKIDDTRSRAVAICSRNALQAFRQKQDPLQCVKEWDCVLRMEPNNDNAKLKREECSKAYCKLYPEKCPK